MLSRKLWTTHTVLETQAKMITCYIAVINNNDQEATLVHFYTMFSDHNSLALYTVQNGYPL